MRVLVSSMALGSLYRTKFRVFTGEASWIKGWVGGTSMVTGCTQQGVSSPEKPMLMRMPSRCMCSCEVDP